MPSLTLKAMPLKLHRELKSRARAHHRSLNKEVIDTLEQALGGGRPQDPLAMLEQARQARGNFKRAVTAKEVTAWVRQGRL